MASYASLDEAFGGSYGKKGQIKQEDKIYNSPTRRTESALQEHSKVIGELTKSDRAVQRSRLQGPSYPWNPWIRICPARTHVRSSRRIRYPRGKTAAPYGARQFGKRDVYARSPTLHFYGCLHAVCSGHLCPYWQAVIVQVINYLLTETSAQHYTASCRERSLQLA